MDLSPASLADLQTLLGRWGYAVIFAGMLLENAGVPLPGETITLLGGYAAGSGQLNLWGVMAAATGGAVLGDNLGYWVGRRLGWPVMLRVGGWLGQRPDQLEQLRLRFLRRAGLSGRIIGSAPESRPAQILGSVTPTCPWYLPPRSRYDVSQTSSASHSRKITCATPSLA